MKRLIEFPLEDGASIMVEVDVPEGVGVERAARPGEIAETAHQTLGRIRDRRRDLTAAGRHRIRRVLCCH